MKTKSKMSAESNMLLFEDDQSIGSQRKFLGSLSSKLNDLIEAFNELEIEQVKFEIADLDPIASGVSPLNFIKMKVLPTLKDVRFSGQKVSPERAFELLKINSQRFDQIWMDITTFVREQLVHAGNREIKLEFNKAFFSFTGSECVVNEAALSEWVERKCRIYAEGEKQLDVYHTIKAIADALNHLRDIGNPSLQSVQALRDNPQFYASSWMGRLIQCHKGEFKVKHEFISSH